MKLKDVYSLEGIYDQPRQHIKKQRHYLPTKIHLVKAVVFPMVIYGCESWTIKKAEHWRIIWCFWTVVLQKTLESPLDCKEIQQVHPKGAQSWVFTGRTDVETETPTLWPSDVKSWLIWEDPDAGKDWGQEERGCWQRMRWLDGITDSMDMSEQAPGGGEGRGSLACCSPWGHKESDLTEWLSNNDSKC